MTRAAAVGRAFSLGLVFIAAAAVMIATATAAPSGSAFEREPGVAPPLLDLAYPGLIAPGDAWGGAVTTSTGETVAIRVASAYRRSERNVELVHSLTALLAAFPHGRELESLNVTVVPREVVERATGIGGRAFYHPSGTIVLPGEEPAVGVEGGWGWDELLAHEYGHHLAASQRNVPWNPLLGTKRWWAAARICARLRGRLLTAIQAGEGFAESYRVLAMRTIGRTPSPLVGDAWFPLDSRALGAIRDDIAHPWVAPRTLVWTRTLRRGETARATVSTPLDGWLSVRVAAGRGSVRVRPVAGRWSPRRGALRRLVCGERRLIVEGRAAAERPLRIEIVRP